MAPASGDTVIALGPASSDFDIRACRPSEKPISGSDGRASLISATAM
ncbi:hypothetical protein [Pseudodonghicola xiamenensis]|nr:hypothetical protein [Pseudodonghicola xiamenensis]